MKKSLLKLSYYSGISHLFKELNKNKVVVLMYHGVMSDKSTIDNGDWLQVKAHEFRIQMAWLKKHYDVCTLDSLLEKPAASTTKPRAVITFDDGYANNYHYALPILEEFGLPATIFITTGMINAHRLFWWDKVYLATHGKMSTDKRFAFEERCQQLEPKALEEYIDQEFLPSQGMTQFSDEAYEAYRPLTHKELLKLAESELITLGSHTHNHEILTQIPDEQVIETLHQSIKSLTPLIGDVEFFAAPHGYYKPQHLEIFKKAGFKAAVSTETKIFSPHLFSPYEIPRIGIGRGYTQSAFAGLISGFWESPAKSFNRFIKN